jgi:ubiquitin-conjugating enzyme E2 G2
MPKRFQKEMAKFATECPEFEISVSEADWRNVTAVIPGTEGPWEGGRFRVELTIPNDYPISPPKARFTHDMFHPNINPTTGYTCLLLLQQRPASPPPGENEYWTPITTICGVLRTLQQLLNDPNTDHGLNTEAMRMYKDNRAEYDRRVKALVAKTIAGGRRSTRKSKKSKKSKRTRRH